MISSSCLNIIDILLKTFRIDTIMIIDRIYKPKRNDIIYHYCDANAFLSICTNKKIRLSDIFSMNDYLEMYWGYQIWIKVANQLILELGTEFIDSIDKIFHSSGIFNLVVSSSFSEEGDVLSQWRAYAGDGTGYVIGFKANVLIKLAVRPLKVLYIEQKQVEELSRIIRSLHMVESQEVDKYSQDFVRTCSNIAYDLAAFKNPAFNEEKEIRLTHLLSFEQSNSSMKLIDVGGHAFRKKKTPELVQFRTRGYGILPFIDIDFTNEGKVNPIKEVIIGPKNEMRETAISIFLETVGINSVIVKKSSASYR